MADPFSIAAGVVGVGSLSLQLLGGCIKGFVILSSARNLDKDAATTVCMLNLQEIQLTEWSRRAGLLTGYGVLDRRINGKAVEEVLAQLQILLTDTEKLKKRYGLDIRLVPSNVSHQHNVHTTVNVNTGISNATRNLILTRSKVAESHTILQRFWWAAVDKEKVGKLVSDIHFFVRELWHLLDPWRQDDIIASTQSIAASILSLNDRFDQLNSFAEALKFMQSQAWVDHLPAQGMDVLATSASIKARRIGLEQTFERPYGDRELNLPSQQNLLRSVESLSMEKCGELDTIDKVQTMGTLMYDGKIVFVEDKPISPSLLEQGLSRARSLAALLSIPKDQTFGSLQCWGIIESREKVRFVFRHPYPESAKQQPRSLAELYHHRHGIKPPSLTERIKLALNIAKLVQNFHRAGWLHKSLRSEHVLFFPNTGSMADSKQSLEPILAGFAFSRPDSPAEVSEQPSVDPKSDIYRHPAALGEPASNFTAEMDVYSLGTILLEIAEWRALRHLVDSVVDVNAETVPLSKVAEVRPFLISGKGKGGTSKLQERMGDIYSSVCQMCFKGKITDIAVTQKSAARGDLRLIDIVVDRLSICCI